MRFLRAQEAIRLRLDVLEHVCGTPAVGFGLRWCDGSERSHPVRPLCRDRMTAASEVVCVNLAETASGRADPLLRQQRRLVPTVQGPAGLHCLLTVRPYKQTEGMDAASV